MNKYKPSRYFTPEESLAYEIGYKDAIMELNTPIDMITINWNPSECPRCHNSFVDYEPCNDGFYDRATSLERCPYCGQKISWNHLLVT